MFKWNRIERPSWLWCMYDYCVCVCVYLKARVNDVLCVLTCSHVYDLRARSISSRRKSNTPHGKRRSEKKTNDKIKPSTENDYIDIDLVVLRFQFYFISCVKLGNRIERQQHSSISMKFLPLQLRLFSCSLSMYHHHMCYWPNRE